ELSHHVLMIFCGRPATRLCDYRDGGQDGETSRYQAESFCPSHGSSESISRHLFYSCCLSVRTGGSRVPHKHSRNSFQQSVSIRYERILLLGTVALKRCVARPGWRQSK